MEVIRDMEWCPRPKSGTVLTIGAYDGVHRGHRAVIAEMHRVAAEWGAKTAVVTFDRHPASIVRPDSAPKIITPPDLKLELLESTGVDYTVVVQFDEIRREESPEDFIDEVLVDCLRAKVVVVGEDFHFGKDRAGDVELLTAVGKERDFSVLGLPLVASSGLDLTISSTVVRRLISSGDVETANRMLGRPFEIRSTVATGDRRGRTIGFPTANLPTPADLLLPADGVYAGIYTRPDGMRYPAAVNVGTRPTFYEDADRSLVEAHLLHFRGDLYDEAASL
ncbi:MAG: bifunctional riboflavin kinase/FAD synthetase, partial [Acidimicrobiales bacterium]